jgi:hypothetical protein
VLFFGGGSVTGYQIRNLSSGILVAQDYSSLYLPKDVWEQSAIILGVGLTLIAAAAVLHPPCARRMCMPPAPGV